MIIKGMGTSHATIPAMNEQEVINFLQSKLNLQLATIDREWRSKHTTCMVRL